MEWSADLDVARKAVALQVFDSILRELDRGLPPPPRDQPGKVGLQIRNICRPHPQRCNLRCKTCCR